MSYFSCFKFTEYYKKKQAMLQKETKSLTNIIQYSEISVNAFTLASVSQPK